MPFYKCLFSSDLYDRIIAIIFQLTLMLRVIMLDNDIKNIFQINVNFQTISMIGSFSFFRRLMFVWSVFVLTSISLLLLSLEICLCNKAIFVIIVRRNDIALTFYQSKTVFSNML